MVTFGSASISISAFYTNMINWNLVGGYYLKYYIKATIQEELTLKNLLQLLQFWFFISLELHTTLRISSAMF